MPTATIGDELQVGMMSRSAAVQLYLAVNICDGVVIGAGSEVTKSIARKRVSQPDTA